MIITGKRINLRIVQIEDAEFLLSLRVDPNKNCYISTVDNNLKKQQQWLQNYKEREQNKLEYYFVIEDKNGEPFGCVRLYDFIGDSFCWGSWILKGGCPSYMAVESALQVYEFAFYLLNFKNCHFDVRKENTSVVTFHERLGANTTHSDDLNYYFKYSKDNYEAIKSRYLRFLH